MNQIKIRNNTTKPKPKQMSGTSHPTNSSIQSEKESYDLDLT